jgi:beclin
MTKHFDYLKKLNVLNDVFKIEIEGEFGTISGFRLGTLGSKGNDVDADEINAALGQCVLLLSTISIKAKFDFDGIELKPMGCNSKIICFSDGIK